MYVEAWIFFQKVSNDRLGAAADTSLESPHVQRHELQTFHLSSPQM